MSTVKEERSIESNPSRMDYDSPWKEVLDHYLQPFLELALPELAREVDWSRPYELLDKELTRIAPDHVTGCRIVDKLVKLWMKSGKEAWLLLHSEIQAQPNKTLPERMFIYRYRLFDKFRKPVISLAILADNDPKWRPECYQEAPYPHEDFALKFKFRIVKLLDFESRRAELEKSANPFAVVILAHLAALKTKSDDQSRYESKARIARRLYEIGLTKKDVINLYKFIDQVLPLPDELADQLQSNIKIWERENKMTYITSAERIGIRRGLERGLERGQEKTFDETLKVFELLKKGLSPKEIKDQVSLSLEKIQKIKAALEKS